MVKSYRHESVALEPPGEDIASVVRSLLTNSFADAPKESGEETPVFDLQDEQVGTAKEFGPHYFRLDRGFLKRDVYVPYEAVEEMSSGAITLKIAAEELDKMGWPRPPVVPRGIV